MADTFGTWVDKNLARRIADAVDTTELPDNDTGTKTGLNTIALRAESDIGQIVNKFDWVSSDRAWPSIQQAATYLTAAIIIDTLYSDDEHLKKAQTYRGNAYSTANTIKTGIGSLTGDNPAILVASSDYLTKGLYDTTHSDSKVEHFLSDF